MKKQILCFAAFILMQNIQAQTKSTSTKAATAPKAATTVQAQSAKNTADAAIKNGKDSASYALGFRIAQSLTGQGLQKINLAVFNKGLLAGFEGKSINNTKPAWTRKPAELNEEDYKNFYKELYPFSEDPLFHIHLNVDYPFNLTGILYFPKLKKNIEVQKNKINLYCNQVFVTDSVEGIVPEFLMLMHGVIDSPDIPLNVSRSYLQSDSNVKKISAHITKKVADRLEELFKESRSDFESKWDDIGVFIKYGMMTEAKFNDRAQKFCLMKNTEGKFFTLEEYKNHVAPAQTDKDGKLVYIYASSAEEQHSFIEAAKVRGYDVLVFEGPLDSHFMNNMEMKLENTSFVRVDSDTAEIGRAHV